MKKRKGNSLSVRNKREIRAIGGSCHCQQPHDFVWDIDPEVWELDSHFPVEIRALFYKLIHDNILVQSSLNKAWSLKVLSPTQTLSISLKKWWGHLPFGFCIKIPDLGSCVQKIQANELRLKVFRTIETPAPALFSSPYF